MLNHAINDCLAVIELYFIIHPLGEDTRYVTPPPPPTTKTIEIYNDELSDISDDEIEISRIDQPKQPQKQQEPQEQQLEQQQQGSSRQLQSKKEKQRRKNEQLKWKKRNLPHFQNKIKRPIYHKYDYRKIRAQLFDDNIFTSHQITINREYNEVIIGFKNKQEQERATHIIKINYFSKNQYNGRWDKQHLLESQHQQNQQPLLQFMIQSNMINLSVHFFDYLWSEQREFILHGLSTFVHYHQQRF